MGEGDWANLSRGGTKLFLDLFSFLAISQEMISATIVALDPLLSSPLGLFPTNTRAILALLRLLFLHDLDHLDGPPRRAPLDLHHIALFLFLIFIPFGSFLAPT